MNTTNNVNPTKGEPTQQAPRQPLQDALDTARDTLANYASPSDDFEPSEVSRAGSALATISDTLKAAGKVEGRIMVAAVDLLDTIADRLKLGRIPD